MTRKRDLKMERMMRMRDEAGFTRVAILGRMGEYSVGEVTLDIKQSVRMY